MDGPSRQRGCDCSGKDHHISASSRGGDTTAISGDAYGGNGGNADANGGSARAGNESSTQQSNSSSGGDDGFWNGGQTQGQSNWSSTHQGDNYATGGDANAYGGNGGDASTGNKQVGNGNALTVEGIQSLCDCLFV